MERVLIAGCGYVGSKLASDLALVPNLEVFGVRRSGGIGLEGVHMIAADIVNGSLAGLPVAIDRIFLCAAPNDSSSQAYEDIYVRSLGRLLEFLEQKGAKGSRLLLTSSTSVYSQGDGEVVTEESPTEPASAGSQCIVRGESMLRPGDTSVRLGGIYGPGRTSFIESVRSGTMVVNLKASAYTNRIHRDDAAAILRFCSGLAKPDQVYNGVDCESATRATVANWLAVQLGVPLKTTTEGEASHFLRGNKRVSNQRLLDAGYQFLYPTFREGYTALMGSGTGAKL
jgi:nucleoside-diphosphate-sugar epimerase